MKELWKTTKLKLLIKSKNRKLSFTFYFFGNNLRCFLKSNSFLCNFDILGHFGRSRRKKEERASFCCCKKKGGRAKTEANR